MKKLKALKITSILNGIFCFCCIASIVFYALNHYYDIYTFFGLGVLLSYGWIINPVGIVSFVLCLSLFLSERKKQEAKQVIGRKWIWIFVWPIITTVFFIISGLLFIKYTGGV